MSDEAPRDNAGKPLSFLNVGTGIDLSIRELAEQVADTIGYKGTIKWDHSKRWNTKKATGYQPSRVNGLAGKN